MDARVVALAVGAHGARHGCRRGCRASTSSASTASTSRRLRQRVARAGERGLYVVVMLFNGWSLHDNGEGNPWPRHPFHPDNNVNGIDGDPDDRGNGDRRAHPARLARSPRCRRLYVERVVETVGDLDCVLWEVSNESPGESRDWQRHLLRLPA